jgi:GxxExxY protein
LGKKKETAKARWREGDAKEVLMNTFEFRERAGSGVDESTEALAQAAIGALIEVHSRLKPGLPENVYRRALAHELTLRGIRFECEVRVPIMYKGVLVGEGFIDVLVDKRLILELKAVDALNEVHRAQNLGYLQAMNLQLALLANFNVALMLNGIKRIINTYESLRA